MIVATTKKPDVGPIPTVIPEPPVFQLSSHDGDRALWVIFVLMVVFSAVFAVLSWNVPVARRIFHIITTLTTVISALAYFAMASGDSSAFNCVEHTDRHRHVPDTYHDVCRQVFWARYVDWTLTSSLILFELFILAGVSGAHTLLGISANIIMFLSGLFSAFGQTHTAQKWGWYTISAIAYVFVVWHVVVNGVLAAKSRESNVTKLFGSLAVYALVLWAIYIVVWGVATNARKTTVDAEIIIYGILDVLTKAGFGLWLLIASRKTRETFHEATGYWSQGYGAEGRIRIGESNGT